MTAREEQYAGLKRERLQAWKAMRLIEFLKAEGADIDWEACQQARGHYEALTKQLMIAGEV